MGMMIIFIEDFISINFFLSTSIDLGQIFIERFLSKKLQNWVISNLEKYFITNFPVTSVEVKNDTRILFIYPGIPSHFLKTLLQVRINVLFEEKSEHHYMDEHHKLYI